MSLFIGGPKDGHRLPTEHRPDYHFDISPKTVIGNWDTLPNEIVTFSKHTYRRELKHTYRRELLFVAHNEAAEIYVSQDISLTKAIQLLIMRYPLPKEKSHA